MNLYRQLLEKKKARLVELETECERLRRFVEAGNVFLAEAEEEMGNPVLPVTPSAVSSEFANLSLPEAMRAFLTKIGSPQAPDSIARGVLAGGYPTTSDNFKALVSPALHRQQQSAQRRNEKPPIIRMNGKWGLREWERKAGKGGQTP